MASPDKTTITLHADSSEQNFNRQYCSFISKIKTTLHSSTCHSGPVIILLIRPSALHQATYYGPEYQQEKPLTIDLVSVTLQ